MSGAELIAAERQRQVEVEGWTLSHDAEHDTGELLTAAAAYVERTLHPSDYHFPPPKSWPWLPSWWKPSADPIRNLVKAGALIAAEIDRLALAREFGEGT